MKSSLDHFVAAICSAFPGAVVTVDPPLRVDGHYHIDIRTADGLAVVRWREHGGITVFRAVDQALDGGPYSSFDDSQAVLVALRGLLGGPS